MTQQEPHDKNIQRIIWIASAVAAVLIICVAVLVFLKVNSDAKTNTTPDSNSSQVLDSKTVPAVTSAKLEQAGDTNIGSLSFSFTAPKKGISVQYRVEDSTKNVVSQEPLIDSKPVVLKVTLVSGANDFVIKARSSDGKSYSNWIVVKDVSLNVENLAAAPEGSDNRQPAEAYFGTAWAKGQFSEQSFAEAMNAAWGATTATPADYCMPLNSGSLAVGEMLPPIPGDTPKDYSLKYSVWFQSDKANVTFLWCEPQPK